ncbi:pitrilysin family protein [Flavobacterium rakeshii]|uniref:M16 family metallopeptidase n=1 Tax=Flavobacterium rakeshii TaxID=1038845 RepID=UPI002E7ACB57|nr:pitrilysin family protein [Flavobacterium rakeshii]MEE1897639.1 pitrilysin family protein [Flavobacterium rakeshii]
MKKVIYILAGLFLSVTSMQAQDRPMPQPGPAPTVNVGKPETFKLKNGLKVLVVENHKLPRVSYTLTMDNAPYAEGSKKGVSDLLSAVIGSGTKKISKEKFNEEIDFLGANINFWASGASGGGLSKYSNRILELMADGALNPIFTQEEFDKQRDKMIEGLKSDEKSVPAVSSRVTDLLIYGKNHPNGEYVTEETLNNVTLNDVVNNYNTYFVPGNAYLVVVGDVKVKDVKKQVEKLFGSWKPAVAPNVSYTDPKDVQYTQIDFVDMPNAVQSEISVVNVSTLKMTDKDYFAAILANQILGGGGEGRLFLNLREAHGWTYGSYSSLGANKRVTSFRATASVRNNVTDSAVVEILNELKKIRTDLVSEEDLKNAKAKYIGNFVMQIEKPSTVAGYALRTETQNLPEDFYENYIKNINAVTPEDIRNAAQKYFKVNNSRIVIVGKAADVLPGLESRKIPINYYDKFGATASKPELNKPVPAGVTAKTVLENYINAIGGEKAVSGVKSISVTASGSVQGMNLEVFKKVTSSNKMAQGLSVMGQTQKMVFDGTKAFVVAQGQTQALPEDQVAEFKKEAYPFPELKMKDDSSITLKGIESYNGSDVYAIVNGDATIYFDVKTGLKVAKIETAQGPQGEVSVTTPYSDYKEVKGVKIPYKSSINIGMEVELTVSDVKINEGVSDADFQ